MSGSRTNCLLPPARDVFDYERIWSSNPAIGLATLSSITLSRTWKARIANLRANDCSNSLAGWSGSPCGRPAKNSTHEIRESRIQLLRLK